MGYLNFGSWMRWTAAAALLAASGLISPSTAKAGPQENDTLTVTSRDDQGPGTLREAITSANAIPGLDTIVFDLQVFAEPVTITLESPLPPLTGDLTIDGYIPDRLWKATGVTVSGGGRFPVFTVAGDGVVTIRHLTVARGCNDLGAGILNHGSLVIYGVTFTGNEARFDGGAVLNLGGFTEVINSTFSANSASLRGGGVATLGGVTVVTNCTFSDNASPSGAGLHGDGELLLRNTILANSEGGADCVAPGVHPASTRNLIEAGEGCGEAITSTDPDLEPLGYFNGPIETYPLRGGSHAINLGDNAAALDENGLPLVWDQRGNGDPRFVAGYTDLGAFEYQRHPHLVVDTLDDADLRACTKPGKGDCPLRGALELANAKDSPQTITFDPQVFAGAPTITLSRPLPGIVNDITLDASGTSGVVIVADGELPVFEEPPGPGLHLIQVVISEPERELPEK